MSSTDVPTPPEHDHNRNDGCGPHCGHWADVQELELLRKQYKAVTDQRDTLIKIVRELKAENHRMEWGK